MPSLLARSRAYDQRVSKSNAFDLPQTEESLALRLSDSQLDALMRLCRPLTRPCRDALLRILAYELRGRRDVGDGELHRPRAHYHQGQSLVRCAVNEQPSTSRQPTRIAENGELKR